MTAKQQGWFDFFRAKIAPVGSIASGVFLAGMWLSSHFTKIEDKQESDGKNMKILETKQDKIISHQDRQDTTIAGISKQFDIMRTRLEDGYYNHMHLVTDHKDNNGNLTFRASK